MKIARFYCLNFIYRVTKNCSAISFAEEDQCISTTRYIVNFNQRDKLQSKRLYLFICVYVLLSCFPY